MKSKPQACWAFSLMQCLQLSPLPWYAAITSHANPCDQRFHNTIAMLQKYAIFTSGMSDILHLLGTDFHTVAISGIWTSKHPLTQHSTVSDQAGARFLSITIWRFAHPTPDRLTEMAACKISLLKWFWNDSLRGPSLVYMKYTQYTRKHSKFHTFLYRVGRCVWVFTLHFVSILYGEIW